LSPMKLAVIDDENTREAAGDRVFKALKGRYASTHVTLDDPAPDKHIVQYLRMQTLSCDALVAVGTGTISDLCKYVSHLDRKPYVLFPTAASMNGYLSANASITEDGFKKTLPAHMPEAVFCDLSVIAEAPDRLNKSGLGDSLARSTAQADWLLSHLLLTTPYDDTPFNLLAPLEPELFENARGIALGDPHSMELLLKTLLLSGLGMTIAGGSYPASQGEHMIAHTYEMMGPKQRVPEKTFHGEEIGVTVLTMARLQEKLLRSRPILRPDDFTSEHMIFTFGSKTTAEARKAFDGKQALVRQHRDKALSQWESTIEKINKVIIPSEKLQSLLKSIGAPIKPEDLNWNPKEYKIAVENARYLRERFTFLDLSPG
jgi:glycerol-1-phosphate dehydrogenase [NAD(P)+]